MQKALEATQATREAALTKLTDNDGGVSVGYRSGESLPALIDKEKRIIELSFSSEHPYARDYGLEVLDHSPGSFDLTFLNSGNAPFMVAPKGYGLGLHEGAEQAGSVMKGSARIDATTRKGRARILVSRSALGDQLINDIEDGVAVNISFDYNASQPTVSRAKNGVATVRFMKVNPRAITRVPLAADPTVGPGRADEEAGRTEDGKQNGARSDAGTQSNNEVNKTLTLEETRAADNARMDAIQALGVRFKNEELATRCALENKSEEETRALILKAINDKQKKEDEGDEGAVGATRDDADKKSPVILISSAIRSFTGTRAEAALKAYRFSKWFLAGPLGNIQSRGIEAAKIYCRDNGIKLVRSQTEGDDTAGGVLVPHEFTNDMIDLREKFGVFRRNVRVVPMASDSKSMPRRKSGLTAYVIGEGKGAEESQKGWERVTLEAKKLGALARYSSEIAEDGLVSMGDDLAQEIAYAFVKFEDAVGFTGDGSLDMMRVLGVLPRLQALADAANTQSIVTASGNSWDEWEGKDFLAAIGKLPEYAEQGEVKWYCSKVFWATVMQRIKFDLTGNRTADAETAQNRTFLGYPVEVSQTLPKAAVNAKVPVFIGNLRLAAMLGDRRATTIATSEHAKFAEEEILIRGTERLAINVHNIEANAEEKAEGLAGPIVGIVNASS